MFLGIWLVLCYDYDIPAICIPRPMREIAADIIVVDTPSVFSPNLQSLAFRNITRPSARAQAFEFHSSITNNISVSLLHVADFMQHSGSMRRHKSRPPTPMSEKDC
jgi:hypothetical protein